jgi:putative tryptophan/tyrosine transport system substrate-binding protein
MALAAALQATQTTPIVMVAIDYDPVALGYVSGLARPGGNVTGVFLQQLELGGKRTELVKEAIPNLARAVLFWDAISADQVKAAELAAASLGITTVLTELRNPPYDYQAALSQIGSAPAEALLVLSSPFFFRDRSSLAETAMRYRLPLVSPFREMTEAGGLLSYGASVPYMYRRAAEYVDKVFKGAKPADLPIEQPTKFEFVINLKTAKALGIVMPQSLLARADEVIE